MLGFGGEEENGLIWRALAAAICVGCVVLCCVCVTVRLCRERLVKFTW